MMPCAHLCIAYMPYNTPSIPSFSFSSVVIVIINYVDRNKNYCNLKYFSSLHFFLLLTGPPRLTIAILRGQSIVKPFLLKKVEV